MSSRPARSRSRSAISSTRARNGSSTRSAALVSGGAAVFSFFSLLIITPVVAFYILIDWDRMIAEIDGWLPLDHRDHLRKIAREIDRALAGFIRGQSLVCLFDGLWYGIGLTLVGLDFGFLIGVIGAVLSFVPYVGGADRARPVDRGLAGSGLAEPEAVFHGACGRGLRPVSRSLCRLAEDWSADRSAFIRSG